ncbi:MAG TPA: hypothetical protein PL044_02220 [Clostridiales bacterium]|nr:hypothetical protein [Clostridiales bacterium]HQH64394.1 hypothetical protein [Clostridiales bacterium]HQK72580.1 hypothetical protein [Clostridiales bacterium]
MDGKPKNILKAAVFALLACALAAAAALADALFQNVADLFAAGSGWETAAWFSAAKHLAFLALCCAGYAVIARRGKIKDAAKALLAAAPASAAYLAAGALPGASPAVGYAAGAAVLAGLIAYFIIKKKSRMYYVAVSLSYALLLILSLAGSA